MMASREFDSAIDRLASHGPNAVIAFLAIAVSVLCVILAIECGYFDADSDIDAFRFMVAFCMTGQAEYADALLLFVPVTVILLIAMTASNER